MLGLRNSFNEIQATAAEMVYGTPLRMPEEFFVDTETYRLYNRQIQEIYAGNLTETNETPLQTLILHFRQLI